NRGQEVSCINIFSTEDFAPVYIVEHEIVCESPVGPEPTEGCLPHMAMCINHAWHENTSGGVDLHRALRNDELPPNCSHAAVGDEDIAALDHSKRGVNGQHSGVTKHHRAS